jgi:hypothetical protein
MVVQSPQMCWTWGVLRLHGCAHAWELRAQLDVSAGLGVCCACMGFESATGCKCPSAEGSLLQRVQALFQPYYQTMMPALMEILKASMQHKSHRRLCGKALECISLIGMSVGKQTFFNDARNFMAVLQQLNAVELEPDDPVLTYVQSAGTRMCKCLGHDFVQMLPVFVPPLLRSAEKKSEFTVRLLLFRYVFFNKFNFVSSCLVQARRLFCPSGLSDSPIYC